ncbi:dTDP-4-dehydrorhamnose 3,5-epimerase [Abditibacterium utsteinense]|uniref:dTDP-4-dehydrorhamnose 3,5-epimerase n=1 Tax=Abditibacterium utsteinense TaxID=1960156 RepID=A0A2S8SW79_9BACT|nr:dTDP-4-dehydrorhamnose 3,5-epimerase [Abditibacterium utsteinense]PQV65055.1 dTDP-4-dehydrorhamnose 3,5-epimerase [Abditibacterium utsteinense]
MKLIETSLPGVLVFEPQVFGDARGFFMETYSARKLAEFGISEAFVQDNHSLSARGTLRGLHYQLKNPQAKLCRVVRGAVLDVAVDVRVGSPHFGEHVAVELTAENKRLIYVPRGFAHGFVVLSEEAEFLYKCDDFYTPGDEGSVAWGDPQIGIDWKLQGEPLLSGKDAVAPRLSEIAPENLPVF